MKITPVKLILVVRMVGSKPSEDRIQFSANMGV